VRRAAHALARAPPVGDLREQRHVLGVERLLLAREQCHEHAVSRRVGRRRPCETVVPAGDDGVEDRDVQQRHAARRVHGRRLLAGRAQQGEERAVPLDDGVRRRRRRAVGARRRGQREGEARSECEGGSLHVRLHETRP
jgi:hypothetical protein